MNKSSLDLLTPVEHVLPGEGVVVEVNKKKVAIYKDDAGNITTYSALCPHMGCAVGWNGKDKTWDCPCHGSRFSKEGHVMKGPAVSDLSREIL